MNMRVMIQGWLQNIWFCLVVSKLNMHNGFKHGVLSLHLISHNFLMWWLEMKQIRKKYGCWSNSLTLSSWHWETGRLKSFATVELNWIFFSYHLLATMSVLLGVKTNFTSYQIYVSLVSIMCILINLFTSIRSWHCCQMN